LTYHVGQIRLTRKEGKGDRKNKCIKPAQPLQKKRPTVMEIRKLEAMLQAREKAEVERKA